MANLNRTQSATARPKEIEASTTVARHQPADPLILEGANVWGTNPPTRNVAAQTNLYMQGSEADEAYLVLLGRFELHADNTLRRLKLGIQARGGWLSVAELLHRRAYATTAVALEPSSVVVITRPMLERLFAISSPALFRAMSGVTWHAMGLLNALESQSLEQTFLGFCRGVELLVGPGALPESQVISRLKELFALTSSSVRELLNLLESLNLINRSQKVHTEPLIRLSEPEGFGERIKIFSERFRGRFPSILGEGPPKEPLNLEAVCDLFKVPPAQFLRRMTLPDFPSGVLRFDPEVVDSLRKTHGDGFFRKKVSGKDLLGQLESLEELIEVDPALLRNVLPGLEMSKLIRLLAGVDEALRNHLLQALSARQRKIVEEEVPHITNLGPQELGDLEQELLALCKGAT